MNESEKDKAVTVLDVNPSSLAIIKYPDPRLQEVAEPLPGVDDNVRAIIDRMFELMFAARGVGLAAPQVALGVRLIVASPTFQQDDRRVFINPEIVDSDGTQDGEEGCLSLPGVNCKIKRKRVVTVRALDREGIVFEQTAEDLPARIIQHEIDHLDGKLLTDRMSTVAKLVSRRTLKELEAAYAGK